MKIEMDFLTLRSLFYFMCPADVTGYNRRLQYALVCLSAFGYDDLVQEAAEPHHPIIIVPFERLQLTAEMFAAGSEPFEFAVKQMSTETLNLFQQMTYDRQCLCISNFYLQGLFRRPL